MSQTTPSETQSVTITAANQFSSEISLQAGQLLAISIDYGTLAGTQITLQRKLAGQATYHDVPNPDGSVGWTAAVEADYLAAANQDVQIGCKTGDFGSGSGTAFIRKG